MYVCHHLDEDWRAPVHPDTPTDPYPHSSTGVHHFQIASYTSMYSTIILQLSFLIGLSVLIRPVGRGGDSRGFAQTQLLASKCLCTTQLYILSALVLFVSGPLVLLPLRIITALSKWVWLQLCTPFVHGGPASPTVARLHCTHVCVCLFAGLFASSYHKL